MSWLEIIKDRIKKTDKGILLVQFIALIIFIIIIVNNQERLDNEQSDRKKHKRYTIGITTEVHHNHRSSSKFIDFQYSYKDTTYSNFGGIGWLDNTVNSKGGRYFVEFSYLNPRNSEMLFDRPVPMDIISSPDTGWVSIP